MKNLKNKKSTSLGEESMKQQQSLGEVFGSLKFLELFMKRPEMVWPFDTTLRDGGQTKGITWTVADKITLIKLIVQAGIRHIEVGWPTPGDKVNPAVFREIMSDRSYAEAGVTFYAFGSTAKADGGIINARNPLIKCLLDVKVPNIVIFGKSWKLHSKEILGVSEEENFRMIFETISTLTKEGRHVTYDAEHAVDGWLEDREYFFRTMDAAARGGAKRIVLCDTRGNTLLPTWIAFLADVLPWLQARKLPWGVHIHNDSGVAVDLSLFAVELGCDQVQGTLGGVGERAGNADLTTIIAMLRTKMGIPVVKKHQLELLTPLTRQMYELAGISMPFNLPIAGERAFHHDAGTHIDCWLKDPGSIEHMPAREVGNTTSLGVSNQIGRAAMYNRLKKIVPNLSRKDPRIAEVLDIIQSFESEGWLFQNARATLELIIRNHFGLFRPKFEVVRCDLHENFAPFDGLPEQEADGILMDSLGQHHTATIKVRLMEGASIIGPKTAEGDGLVNALDLALRSALQERGGRQRPALFPELRQLELINYNVKALIDKNGTAAKVRVTLYWKSNGDIWGTTWVSSSVTEASTKALIGGYHYFLDWYRRQQEEK